jgi:hypothetical protein
MAQRSVRKDAAQSEENGSDLRQAATGSAGQSSDAQGVSQVAEVDDESVGELAETDQAYEAEAVEDAGDHSERPVRSHEDKER